MISAKINTGSFAGNSRCSPEAAEKQNKTAFYLSSGCFQ